MASRDYYVSLERAEQDRRWCQLKGFVIGAATVALFWAVTGATAQSHVPSYADDLDEETRIPRLVGFGCKGSSGPLFANEEDHFPKCQSIEAWR